MQVPQGVERGDVDEHEERGDREPWAATGTPVAKRETDTAKAVDQSLAEDCQPVDRAVVPERGAGGRDDQQRDRHQATKDLVREQLQRVEAVAARIEQVARDRDAAQAAGHDPDLPTVFASARPGDGLPRDRTGLEDEPSACGDDPDAR